MSFELRAEESLGENVARILRKQLDHALEQLTTRHKGSRDEAVHEVRKCLKRVRAVLRLIRPAAGEKTYRAENLCYRDCARPLTEVRDAKIFVEALDALVEHFAERLAGRAFTGIRKRLQDNLRAVRRRVLVEQNAFAVAAETLRQAHERVSDWADVPDRWSAVGQGLKTTYRRAEAAFHKAVADPTVEKLHEWRKQAKYLRYQLEILVPIWPERLEEVVHETDEMGEWLGDDHDLAVLGQMLTDHPDRFGDPGDREMLQALIDRRRMELQHEAQFLGERFFQDRPREFVHHLRGYWKTWRAQIQIPTMT